MKHLLYASAALALIALGWSGTLLLLDARALVKAQHGVVQREAQLTRDLIDKHAEKLRADADAQLKALRTETLAEVAAWRTASDAQLTGARRDVLVAVANATGPLYAVAGTVEQIRKDAEPVLKNAAALESDAKDSIDDLYWDVKASVASATVAARGVAETSEAVGKAAPKITASFAGIAADANKATSDFVAPKTFWQKFKAWLETAGKLAARFL